METVEQELQRQVPDRWRRVSGEELKRLPLTNLAAGWRVEIPADAIRHQQVDHILIVVDSAFPNTQPRVFAPQAPPYGWPHVEEGGLLCLEATKLACAPADRIIQHLEWAHQLLNFSASERRLEFEREFGAYWTHRCSDNHNRLTVLSLLKPAAPSREIYYFDDWTRQRIVVADDRKTLSSWLQNSGIAIKDNQISSSWLVILQRPWTPEKFPETSRDVFDVLSEEGMNLALVPNRRWPVLFSTKTPTGPVFAAVLLPSFSEKAMKKGFRNNARIPRARVELILGKQHIQRCPVRRVDASWIHGRDHDANFSLLRARSVAIIGCGAVGAAVARLLAQSGVGRFLLIDSDVLSSSNIARHVLGNPFIGRNKAQGTAKMLGVDFPHMSPPQAYAKRFERLTRPELQVLESVDLIISAGIDFDGDASLDAWRIGLAMPPVHVCTWVEEFALAGHAVALFGRDSLMVGFDENERPKFRLTDWPAACETLIVEAGCGNLFQPHGVLDLQSTIVLAASLAIDILQEIVPASCRRVWQGSLVQVTKHGGTPTAEFTQSNSLMEMPWP